MKPLFIFDLEGTTGIYTTEGSETTENKVLLRQGFRGLVQDSNQGRFGMVITSRLPGRLIDEIKADLAKKGIDIHCKVYALEDIKPSQVNDNSLHSYKDYSKVFNDHKLTEPDTQAIIIGDLFRFPYKDDYSKEDFMKFNFTAHPNIFSNTYCLSSTPLPVDKRTPLYVVLPKPMQEFDSQETIALDLNYVVGFLQNLYELGNRNFKKGLELSRTKGRNQHVVHSGLARRILEIEHFQDYLIMKGKNCHWKPLETIR